MNRGADIWNSSVRSFPLVRICRTRSGSWNGRPFRKRSLISEKIAVFSPIPSARVTTAMTVNPGDLRSCRNAKRISFMIAVSLKVLLSFCAQRDDWIDARVAAGWHAAGDQGNEHQRNYGCDYSPGIDCADVVKQRHQRAAGSNRADEPYSNADSNQCHALAEHELENVCALSAERNANPELASALCDRERHHAVETHARKHEREHGKRA